MRASRWRGAAAAAVTVILRVRKCVRGRSSRVPGAPSLDPTHFGVEVAGKRIFEENDGLEISPPQIVVAVRRESAHPRKLPQTGACGGDHC